MTPSHRLAASKSYCETCKTETEKCQYYPAGSTAPAWHVTGRTLGVWDPRRAPTLDTARDAIALGARPPVTERRAEYTSSRGCEPRSRFLKWNWRMLWLDCPHIRIG